MSGGFLFPEYLSNAPELPRIHFQQSSKDLSINPNKNALNQVLKKIFINFRLNSYYCNNHNQFFVV